MADENYYFGKAGPEVETSSAFAKFIQYCTTQGHRSAWVATPGIRNATFPAVTNSIGEKNAKRLAKGEAVGLHGVTFRLQTEKTMPYGGEGCPILALWPTENHLNALDRLSRVPALFVVPWQLAQVATWVLARRPVNLLSTEPESTSESPSGSVVSNSVVEAALETIATSINLATGIIHPDDKKTVIEAFKLLKTGGENYTGAEVQAWLMQKGMSAKHAAEVAKVASDPAKFRASRASKSSYLPPNALERWRARAEGK